VGSGKTALTLALCRALRDEFNIAVVTNDIYAQENAQFLVRHEAIAPNESSAWRPAAVRTRQSARMRRSISKPSRGSIADFDVMEHDAKKLRGERPFVFTNLKDSTGLPTVLDWLRGDLQQPVST
jgi:Ni2+-binding GTPase involved in maturation of urease and hydrogenase